MPAERTVVEVEGRRLSLSHLDKPLYPAGGFTKAAVLQHYGQVGPVMLPHLEGRPASFVRCPGGVDGERFWAKRVPPGAPGWVQGLEVELRTGPARQVVVADLATLIWAANLDTVEFHVPQWRDSPALHDRLIVDLDPGEGTDLLHCCAAALAVREVLAADGLDAWAKTSGSKGLHLTVPLIPAPADEVNAYAKRLAQRLKAEYPQLIVSRMGRELRRDRVLLDWSQNNSAKTTVAAYSLRALAEPTVSTPVSWAEVADCRDPAELSFTADRLPDRLARLGDLHASLLDPSAARRLPGAAA
ncbi:non-homologous end-joining DNA ligase [Streptacidiphilus carbonis]|uniref:non-homologous end-joining DNA ligase n=1 Tax=Streptacidiphilus carbonis TaxID=105422 RepID=UPI0005A62216|nr:non-homologous end-joining DNA ligase [Streptacidiphilus carbonis]